MGLFTNEAASIDIIGSGIHSMKAVFTAIFPDARRRLLQNVFGCYMLVGLITIFFF